MPKLEFLKIRTNLTPAALAEVRAELALRTPEDARRLAEAALAAPSAAAARAAATIVPTA